MSREAEARAAYAEDCRRQPTYPADIGGGKRPSWDALEDHVKESWRRNPTPRKWAK